MTRQPVPATLNPTLTRRAHCSRASSVDRSIPLSGSLSSLNAAAVAIGCFEVARQRQTDH